MQSNEYYFRGAIEGKYTEFDTDGNIIVDAFYKSGVLDSFYVSYSNTGKIIQKFHYKNGKKDGEQKIFYPSGELKSISNYYEGYPGMGLIEYEVDGTMIQQNIQIYTEEKDLSTLNYSYVITLKILPERKVTFYIAEDRNAKSISQFLFQVLKKDGIFKHTIKVYPGDYVLTSFKILALTKSAQGNELVLAKNMDIAAGH